VSSTTRTPNRNRHSHNRLAVQPRPRASRKYQDGEEGCNVPLRKRVQQRGWNRHGGFVTDQRVDGEESNSRLGGTSVNLKKPSAGGPEKPRGAGMIQRSNKRTQR